MLAIKIIAASQQTRHSIEMGEIEASTSASPPKQWHQEQPWQETKAKSQSVAEESKNLPTFSSVPEEAAAQVSTLHSSLRNVQPRTVKA